MASDSFVSEKGPSTVELEKALRNAVQDVYIRGDLGQLTIKRIRKVAEGILELENDFFKQNPTWKNKSKAIIESEVDAQAQEMDDISQSSQHSLVIKPMQNIAKGTESAQTKKSGKRASDDDETPNKRRKIHAKSSVEGFSQERVSVISANGGKCKAVKRRTREKSPKVETGGPDTLESAMGGSILDNPDEIEQPLEAPSFESEMSDVIDEKAKPKAKRRKSLQKEVKKPKAKKNTSGARSKEDVPAVDSDADEIKRLQGWLIKCGIRKLWHKELSRYDNSISKIGHLKKMLVEAGMTGRYSVEKANSIREERELRADLEAVQAGAKQWGREDPSDEEGRPRRRLARGLKELDFLNDDDGEETD